MWQVVEGDNRVTMRQLPDACIDAVVTDPPYELGFMGKKWDASGIAFSVELWEEVLRVLKPGGHLLAFSGTRTYHRMVCAIEDAGFEIRDQLGWFFGTGFPKSLGVGKAIDKAAGAEPINLGQSPNWREAKRDNGQSMHGMPNASRITAPATPDAVRWQGWGTALKPAQEPIVLARRPFAKGSTVAENVLEHGTGGLNVDGCRVGTTDNTARRNGSTVWFASGDPSIGGGHQDGRWPANVLLDETAGGLLDEQSGYSKSPGKTGRGAGGQHGASRFFYVAKASRAEREAGLDHMRKASAGELTGGRAEGSAGLDNPRAGAGRTSSGRANTHPTVKPIALMQYLCRLITPPGGVVLDPFTGSGSTGCAAVLEGFSFLGLELQSEYCDIARTRIAHHAASTT